MENPDLVNSEHPMQVPKLTAITKPMGTTIGAEEKCYICTVPAASTHRADGKKLPFVFGFMRTKILQDIAHMEHEINEGNPYFRHATPEEIESYDMRTDPKGTLTRNIKADPAVRAEIEGGLRVKLEAEIRAEIAANSGGKSSGAVAAVGSAEEKLKTLTTAVVNDEQKLQGSDIASRIKRPDVVQTAGATLIHASNKPPITPVSTVDVAPAAQQSGK